MLHYDVTHWVGFLTFALLLNLAPGPDLAFILGQTARGGKAAGTAAMFGIWTGALVHVLLAVAGLSAIVATSAYAFAVVKWIGVGYLLWLSVQAFQSDGTAWTVEEGGSGTSRWAVFRQGVLVDVLNPKVAIFFLALLPQFVRADAGPIWLQTLVHGVLIIAVAAVVEPPLILLGDRLTRRLRASRRLARMFERGLGAMFAGLGVKLALTER